MKKLYIFLAFSLLFLVFFGCKDKNNSIPTKKQEIPTSTNVKQEDLNNSIGNILIPNMVQEDAQINHNENLNSGSNTEDINNQVKADGKTLNEQLFDSILQNDLDSVKNLIDEGADINAKDSVSGFYPIILATIKGYKDIVELLIQNNADLNVRDKEDFNAFLYAIRDGHPDIAKILLDNGAGNVNDIKTCWSPLHIAIDGSANNVATMKFLLANGADVNIKSCMDETPLENVSLCDTDRCKEMTELLKSYGAK